MKICQSLSHRLGNLARAIPQLLTKLRKPICGRQHNPRTAAAATHSGLRLSPVDDHDDPLTPADDRLPFVGSSGPARRNCTTGLSPVVNSLTSTGDKSESTGDKIDANLSPVDDHCHQWSLAPTKCKYSRI